MKSARLYSLFPVDVRDVVIFLIPMVIYGIALFIYFPGIMTYDSYDQWMQIETSTFSDGHPFVHTFIELILLKVYRSPATIALFQIVTFSFLWAVICRYNRIDNKSSIYALQLLLTVIIALNPINSIHSVTLWKDVLYSYSLMCLCFLVQIGFDRSFKYTFMELVGLGGVIALPMHLRHNGLIVSLGMLITIFIAIHLLQPKSKSKYVLLLVAALFYLIFRIPYIMYGVERFSYNTNSKLLQIVGGLVTANAIDHTDQNKLQEFVDLGKLKKEYNPYFSDPIGNAVIDYGKLDENKHDLYLTIIRHFFKHPEVLFRFVRDSTTIVWNISRPPNSIGTILSTDSSAVNNTFGIRHIFRDTALYRKSNQFIGATLNNRIIRCVLYSPALYLYISCIMITVVMISAGKWGALIIFPNLFNVLGIALTIPVQDVRYLYGNFLVAYLTILISIPYLLKSRKSGSTLKRE